MNTDRDAALKSLRREWWAAIVAGQVTNWWGAWLGALLLVSAMNGHNVPGAVGGGLMAAGVFMVWWKWDRPRTRPAESSPARICHEWPEWAANSGIGKWVRADDAQRLGIVPDATFWDVLLRTATVAQAHASNRLQKEIITGDRGAKYPLAPEILDVEETEHDLILIVVPLPGQDVRSMARHAAALALAAGVRHVEVRLGEPGTVRVTLRWGDPLANVAASGTTTSAVEPDGLAQNVGMVRRPPEIIVGRTERGEEWRLPLSQMTLVGGVPGSGKSVFLNVALAEASKLDYVQNFMIDLKGGLEFAVHEPRAYRVAGSHEEAADVIEEACAIMDARMDEMRSHGVRYFGDLPDGFTSQRPLVIVWVDEAAELFGKPPGEAKASRELAGRIESGMSRLVRLSRAMGFSVIVATQKPTADAIPSQIRDGLQERICFRVSTVEQARAIFGDPSPEMTEAASSITKDQRGYAVVRSEDGDWTRARGAFLSDQDVIGIVRGLAHLRQETIS